MFFTLCWGGNVAEETFIKSSKSWNKQKNATFPFGFNIFLHHLMFSWCSFNYIISSHPLILQRFNGKLIKGELAPLFKKKSCCLSQWTNFSTCTRNDMKSTVTSKSQVTDPFSVKQLIHTRTLIPNRLHAAASLSSHRDHTEDMRHFLCLAGWEFFFFFFCFVSCVWYPDVLRVTLTFPKHLPFT